MLVLGVPLEIMPTLSDEITVHIWAIKPKDNQSLLHHLFSFKGYFKLGIRKWYIIWRELGIRFRWR